MNVTRKLGILIFTAVPAIVGGGIVYDIFGHSYPAVALYEILLIIGAVLVVRKG